MNNRQVITCLSRAIVWNVTSDGFYETTRADVTGINYAPFRSRSLSLRGTHGGAESKGTPDVSAADSRTGGTMSFVIRPTRIDDAPHLPAIERSASSLFATIAGLAWIVDASDMPLERHVKFIENGTSWVASADDDRVVAFLCAEVTDDLLHVWEMSVALQYQRLGIGRALMSTAIGFARQRQLASVTLTTFRAIPWNEPAYRRMGFVTLSPDEHDHRIAEILGDEAAVGLSKELRCAMRFTLRAVRTT